MQRIVARRHPVEVCADGDQLDAVFVEQPCNRRVVGDRIGEFGHHAENGDPPAANRQRRQRLDRSTHRSGIGVVGIVDHDGATRCDRHFHSPRRQWRPAERRRCGLEVDSARGRHRDRCCCVHCHVSTADGELDPRRSPRRVERETGPREVVQDEVDDPHVGCAR